MERKLGAGGRPHASQGRSRLHAPAGFRGGPRTPTTVKGPPPTAPPPPRRRSTPRALLFVRYGVPGTIIAAGAIALCFGTEDSFYGGVSLIGAGLSVWLISWAYRLGVRGDTDRDAEDQARRYYDRFGRWPDERR
jgi:hypothetical protein